MVRIEYPDATYFNTLSNLSEHDIPKYITNEQTEVIKQISKRGTIPVVELERNTDIKIINFLCGYNLYSAEYIQRIYSDAIECYKINDSDQEVRRIVKAILKM